MNIHSLINKISNKINTQDNNISQKINIKKMIANNYILVPLDYGSFRFVKGLNDSKNLFYRTYIRIALNMDIVLFKTQVVLPSKILGAKGVTLNDIKIFFYYKRNVNDFIISSLDDFINNNTNSIDIHNEKYKKDIKLCKQKAKNIK